LKFEGWPKSQNQTAGINFAIVESLKVSEIKVKFGG